MPTYSIRWHVQFQPRDSEKWTDRGDGHGSESEAIAEIKLCRQRWAAFQFRLARRDTIETILDPVESQ